MSTDVAADRHPAAGTSDKLRATPPRVGRRLAVVVGDAQQDGLPVRPRAALRRPARPRRGDRRAGTDGRRPSRAARHRSPAACWPGSPRREWWRSTSIRSCSPSLEGRWAATSACASCGATYATRGGPGRLDGVEADAVVTSTALHWLPEGDLARLYCDLHGVVRPGSLVRQRRHDAGRRPAAPQQRPVGARRAARGRGAGRRRRVLARLVAACGRGSGAGRADGRAGRRCSAARTTRRRSSPRRGGTSPRWRPPASPRPAWPGGRAPTPSSPPSADPRHAGRCRPRRDWSPRRGPAVGLPPNWGGSSGSTA